MIIINTGIIWWMRCVCVCLSARTEMMYPLWIAIDEMMELRRWLWNTYRNANIHWLHHLVLHQKEREGGGACVYLDRWGLCWLFLCFDACDPPANIDAKAHPACSPLNGTRCKYAAMHKVILRHAISPFVIKERMSLARYASITIVISYHNQTNVSIYVSLFLCFCWPMLSSMHSFIYVWLLQCITNNNTEQLWLSDFIKNIKKKTHCHFHQNACCTYIILHTSYRYCALFPIWIYMCT